MNIDLIYKSNSFNFDLRKDISVKYLEDMASKLISKDKSYFDLFYNNNNLSEYSNSLLKDVTQNEGTIPIVISPKINQRRKISNKIYLK
jgi:ABC-type thiamine transport system substrate-binding protein